MIIINTSGTKKETLGGVSLDVLSILFFKEIGVSYHLNFNNDVALGGADISSRNKGGR